MTNYNIDTHAHRFAIWTAARAVQQPGHSLSTDIVRNAVEKSGLQNEIEQIKDKDLTHDDFKEWHMRFIPKMQEKAENAPWGILAKIIAIYIKTYWILRAPSSNLARVAFPPLDSILLKNLAELKGLENLKVEKWTKFDGSNYYPLIDRLREYMGEDYFWKIEVYWNQKEY